MDIISYNAGYKDGYNVGLEKALEIVLTEGLRTDKDLAKRVSKAINELKKREG